MRFPYIMLAVHNNVTRAIRLRLYGVKKCTGHSGNPNTRFGDFMDINIRVLRIFSRLDLLQIDCGYYSVV